MSSFTVVKPFAIKNKSCENCKYRFGSVCTLLKETIFDARRDHCGGKYFQPLGGNLKNKPLDKK